MRTLIAIPSKNRSEILLKNAWQWAKHYKGDLKIFIEPQDQEKYVMFMDYVEVLEKDNQGLGYAKQAIKKYAIDNGYDLVFKIDDDVNGFTKFRQKLSPLEVSEFLTNSIEKFAYCFKFNRYLKAISFPYSFEMYESFIFKATKRVQTAYIVRPEFLCVDPKISVFEDFAVGLSILVKNGIILKFGNMGISMGVAVGKGTGGHQSFDRKAQALKEVELLRKIYPPLSFRKVKKLWGIEPDLKSVKL